MTCTAMIAFCGPRRASSLRVQIVVLVAGGDPRALHQEGFENVSNSPPRRSGQVYRTRFTPMSNGKARREDSMRSSRFGFLPPSCHEDQASRGPIGFKLDNVGLFDKVEELWGFVRRVCMEDGREARQLLRSGNRA
jgi:hypothetical protein